MKKTLWILSFAFLLSCGNAGSGSNKKGMQMSALDQTAEMADEATDTPSEVTDKGGKKYDIKSGIITFQTSMEMSGMNIKTTKILYFDDYGIKECEEEYKLEAASGKEELISRNFVKDGFQYICSVENKGGMKTSARGIGVAAKFDMDEAATLKDNQFKKLAEETVCGKSCSAFSMVTPSGNIKMYGWNRIVLKTTLDNASLGMKSQTVATRIEENVSIPADRFEVPKDVVMQDM